MIQFKYQGRDKGNEYNNFTSWAELRLTQTETVSLELRLDFDPQKFLSPKMLTTKNFDPPQNCWSPKNIYHQGCTMLCHNCHVTPCCAVLSHGVPCCTTSYHYAPSSSILHNVAPSCTMLHHVEPCCTMLNHVAPCWTMLHHVVPCCIMFNHVDLCSTMLNIVQPYCTCWTILHHLAP